MERTTKHAVSALVATVAMTGLMGGAVNPMAAPEEPSTRAPAATVPPVVITSPQPAPAGAPAEAQATTGAPAAGQPAAAPATPTPPVKKAATPAKPKSEPKEVLPWSAEAAKTPPPAAPKSAAVQCEGLFEAACKETPPCKWVDQSTLADGTAVTARCTTPKKPQAAKPKPKPATAVAPPAAAEKPAPVAVTPPAQPVVVTPPSTLSTTPSSVPSAGATQEQATSGGPIVVTPTPPAAPQTPSVSAEKPVKAVVTPTPPAAVAAPVVPVPAANTPAPAKPQAQAPQPPASQQQQSPGFGSAAIVPGLDNSVSITVPTR